MIRAAHLLDDFALGGVSKGLAVFDEPELASIVQSRVEPMAPGVRLARRYDADILFLHSPPSWQRLAWQLSLRLLNPEARIIHVEHSYTAGFERENVANRKRFRLMLRLAMQMVDEIVCVSDAQRLWLQEAAAVPAYKIRTIYPWSGHDELALIAPAVPRAGEPLRFGAYGRLAKVKNFAALIEGAQMAGADLCSVRIGGIGPMEEELASAASASANVEMVGKVTDVRAFLADVDAVIIPSLHESFCQVALEARLGGRPILVADVDGLPEQVGQAGLVSRCRTSADIADAITRFAAMPLAEMALAARASAIGHRDKVVSGWVAVICAASEAAAAHEVQPAMQPA